MRLPPPHPPLSAAPAGRIGPLALVRRTFLQRRGASASEFAIIAGPFFIMILAICEAAWQLATGAALDHAALKASRFGGTGANSIPAWQRGSTPVENMPTCRSAGIGWMVSQSTGSLIKQGANLTVTTNAWSNLGGLASAGTPSAGTGSQITSYTIRYRQPFITGGIAGLIWGGDSFTHQTTIVIKNEPFENASC
ncbi:TadE family protein [Roseomonas fluvialis]|uniref:TadE-like domain-containing protein n=1 Tax=Roseomonas fluvialis TaxID=1750527 RepID=A0ABN6P3Y3_9PROT|nr:TadE/TadG family type IV pilus assembly protein [Roseomonas fluvialis]BDG73367.1 hypothetical protein Rmf_32960 [Roseomonas fluvialis]